MSFKDNPFFSSYSLILALALVLFGIGSGHLIKKLLLEGIQEELKSSLELSKELVLKNQLTIASWCEAIPHKKEVRLSVIDTFGKLWCDTELGQTSGNYSDRPEMVEAFDKGLGQSIRSSELLKQDYFYMALKIQSEGQGNDLYLRMAIPLLPMEERFSEILLKLLGLVLVIYFPFFYLGSYLVKGGHLFSFAKEAIKIRK